MGEARLLGPEEWRVWRDLRLRSLADAPDAFGSTLEQETTFGEARWRARLAGPAAVAFEAGVAAALGGGFAFTDRFMVYAMWTDPAHRRRGLATVVLDVLVAHARPLGLPIQLHVNVANPAARATYERYGFVGTGELEPLRPGSDQRIELLRLA